MTLPGFATDIPILARLKQHRAIGHAPAIEHVWLAEHGERVTYPVGHVVTAKGVHAKNLLIVFEGLLVIRADLGAGSQKIFEWGGGDLGGAMPYSRGATPPNDVLAEAQTEALTLPEECFTELTRECPVVTAAVVHAMLDRARRFTTSDLHAEKLKSLGKLAAGLAHELNNPASAVVRSAKLLMEGLASAEEASRILAGAGLTEEQFAAIDRARTLTEASLQAAPRSPIERADREDELTDWLADHSATQEYAVPLADSGVTPTALDDLAEQVSGEALEAALGWISACTLVRALATEIESASLRIHDLVAAVKGFSYMDHAPSPEPVDIRRGLADTLTMLGSKTKNKNVNVTMSFPDDLPDVHAVGAELNQVWMNLIDNAIDAVDPGGRIDVIGSVERDRVIVKIIDDGPGIPPEVKSRMWDQFFTTKGVGNGSGLGLDIVRRLLQRHDAAIDVDSIPGRTEFQVRLHVAR
jgi:signal transduction histidine kinase